MKYPPSERLGNVTAPDGKVYDLNFYGENEGAAVIGGPLRFDGGHLAEVPEVVRVPAESAEDAREKLLAWWSAHLGVGRAPALMGTDQ
jgi:hypothetical protein